MSFQSKNELAAGQQLKVQELAIPFTITANATPASVVTRNDLPAVMFTRTEGVDGITVASGALESGETATFSVSPVDANGIINILLKLTPDTVAKVVSANVIDRVNGGSQPCKLGDADGLSSLGKIMLTMDATTNLATTNLDACLIVKYIVAE